MESLLVILIGTVLVNTFLLMHDDPTLAGDRSGGVVVNAIRIANASLITLVLAVWLTLAIWPLFGNTPGDVMMLVYSFAVVTIAIGLHRITRRRLPLLRRSLATSPILVVSNCLALGAALLNAMYSAPIFDAVGDSLALAVGFAAMLIVFATLASRITQSEVPVAFRVAPITLVSAGLVALALLGFTGLVRA
jgi:Na+-translocating ferredoxin:NAD+ oxidoreductase subunit A